MTYSDLKILIGSLTGDPSHDRYSTTDILTELDNSMDKWNVEAKIIKDTVTITVVDGTRQYAISTLTGTPISFPRATHKGLLLKKRSKSYFDMFSSGVDWTTTSGTPTDFCVEITDPDTQYITLYPKPTGNDAGAYLVLEYIKRHTSMSADSDTPFMSGTTVNSLLRPYDWGLAYEVAARLLARDPDVQGLNASKATNFAGIGRGVLADVIQVFKALEAEEPMRIRPSRMGVRRRSISW
jgi:hypothetical protein